MESISEKEKNKIYNSENDFLKKSRFYILRRLNEKYPEHRNSWQG